MYFYHQVFHILPLKQTEEIRSGTLPGYKHNQDKCILGSRPHMMKLKVLLNNIRRKITHSKLLPMLKVLKMETSTSITHDSQNIKYMKYICHNYDHTNKELHL
jgi:hypothetical protein